MSQTVRIPDPIAQDAKTEAEQRDVAVGTVIEEWRRKAEKYERMEGRR